MPIPLKIEYLPIAEADLQEIFDYIFAESPSSAQKTINLFDKNISNLALFPLLGKTVNDPILRAQGYRLLIIDNYLVFYVIIAGRIEIRRVIHGTRHYAFLL